MSGELGTVCAQVSGLLLVFCNRMRKFVCSQTLVRKCARVVFRFLSPSRSLELYGASCDNVYALNAQRK